MSELSQIHDTLTAMSRGMGRLEGKVDAMSNRLTEHIVEHTSESADREKRLTSLENSRSRYVGYAAGVSAAVSIAWKFLTHRDA